jgi:F-type H+/Na+-transporting ATPase subunit alpha
MVEVLKQEEHNPFPMEKQVIAIFACTNGYYDDIAIANIKKTETELLQYIERSHAGVIENIRTRKELTDENKKALIAAIEAFKKERV